ncbi:hypothetical protein AALP_AA5G060400 [Arabis alpina]|uniref:FBD domain-containing protein n=1 Tax=Arabis alpina TaxID=50452 RepID=A0A087GV86_ARAAL|nr:hypothetical protein AALP_AA5G060400 [Arabis alpina]
MNDAHGFVIDAPSLECLDIVVYKAGFCAFDNNMSKIVKANIDVNYLHPGKVLSSITSVERLKGSVSCCDSPKLRGLKLDQCHTLRSHEPRPCWIEPSSVPDCLLSSLETFEWVKYEGTEEEKEVAAFILRTGSCLQKVTISSKSTELDKKFEMLKELSLSFRRSPTCQLAFD